MGFYFVKYSSTQEVTVAFIFNNNNNDDDNNTI